MENEKGLYTLADDKKLSLAIKYLKRGGELTVNGVTYVWLDNYVTREEEQEDGEIEYFGIDGLAIKGERNNLTTGEKSAMYIGQQDMPMRAFLTVLKEVSEEEWFGIASSIALQSMIPKRD